MGDLAGVGVTQVDQKVAIDAASWDGRHDKEARAAIEVPFGAKRFRNRIVDAVPARMRSRREFLVADPGRDSDADVELVCRLLLEKKHTNITSPSTTQPHLQKSSYTTIVLSTYAYMHNTSSTQQKP